MLPSIRDSGTDRVRLGPAGLVVRFVDAMPLAADLAVMLGPRRRTVHGCVSDHLWPHVQACCSTTGGERCGCLSSRLPAHAPNSTASALRVMTCTTPTQLRRRCACSTRAALRGPYPMRHRAAAPAAPPPKRHLKIYTETRTTTASRRAGVPPRGSPGQVRLSTAPTRACSERRPTHQLLGGTFMSCTCRPPPHLGRGVRTGGSASNA